METLDDYYKNQDFPKDPPTLEKYIQSYFDLLKSRLGVTGDGDFHYYNTSSNSKNTIYFTRLLTHHYFGATPEKIEFKAKTGREHEERWSIDLSRTNPFCWHYRGGYISFVEYGRANRNRPVL